MGNPEKSVAMLHDIVVELLSDSEHCKGLSFSNRCHLSAIANSTLSLQGRADPEIMRRANAELMATNRIEW